MEVEEGMVAGHLQSWLCLVLHQEPQCQGPPRRALELFLKAYERFDVEALRISSFLLERGAADRLRVLVVFFGSWKQRELH